MGEIFGESHWPTTGLVNAEVPGQLAWPFQGRFEAHQTVTIVDSPPNELLFAGSAPGRYLDHNGKLYEWGGYVGLRGHFDPETGIEMFGTLNRYPLWRMIGYSADRHASAADIAYLIDQQTAFNNAQQATPLEPALGDLRNMYFFDGVTRDDLGEPVMTLYYQDGQGQDSTRAAEIGVDFYQMRRQHTSAAGRTPNRNLASTGTSGGIWHDVIETDYDKMDRSMQLASLGGVDLEAMRVPGVEQTAGQGAAQSAHESTYAHDLSYTGSLPNIAANSPLLSNYAVHRTGQMLQIAENLVQATASVGSIGTNPDALQSRIDYNIRTTLLSEAYDFSESEVEKFFSDRTINVNTMSPQGRAARTAAQNQAGARHWETESSATDRSSGLQGPDSNWEGASWSRPLVQTITVKGPSHWIKPPSRGIGNPVAHGQHVDPNVRPQLLQRYPRDYSFAGWTLRTSDSRTATNDVFFFPYTPDKVSYQGLSAQWIEVPRTGDLPIVEFNKWTLMKVSMEFIISNVITNPITGITHPDGLRTSVYESLETLRRIASRPFPISVFGMDQLFRVSMKRAEVTGQALEFVISDLQVNSTRRTIDEGDKEITAAQCKLTLQEIPIEEMSTVIFPRPNLNPIVVAAAPDATQSEATLITEGMEAHAGATMAVTTAEEEATIASQNRGPLTGNAAGWRIVDDGRPYGVMDSEWNGESEYK